MSIHTLLKLAVAGAVAIFPLIFSYIKTKRLKIGILSSIFFVLGFNIAYHFISPDSYINGKLIYYKIPNIHIIDILCLLFVAYLVFKKVLSFPKPIILITLCIPLVVHFSYPALSYTLKYILYLTTAFSISKTYSQKEIGLAVKFGLLPALCLNLFVASYQVIFRHSLGLSILGEPIINKAAIDIAAISLGNVFIVRGYGFLQHPNVLAGLSLFALLVTDKTIYSKTITSILRIISTLIILLTFSKAGIFLLAIYWLIKIVPHKFHKILIIFFTLTAITIIGAGVYTTADFTRIRLEQLNQSLLYFTSNLPSSLLGMGITGFLDLSSIEPIIQSTGTYFIQPIHNIFLSIIIEYGLACIGWGVLIGAFIITQAKHISTKTVNLFALLLIMVIGTVDHYFLTIPTGIFIFCMLLAISNQVVTYKPKLI